MTGAARSRGENDTFGRYKARFFSKNLKKQREAVLSPPRATQKKPKNQGLSMNYFTLCAVLYNTHGSGRIFMYGAYRHYRAKQARYKRIVSGRLA